MFDWFFKKREKKELKHIEEDTKKGFESVKKDITAVIGWIKHLDSEKNLQQKEIEDIKEDLSTVKNDIESIKNIITMMNELKPQGVFKTNRQVFKEQTPVYAVQTVDQTGVQTPNLNQFSVTERAILWILLNSEMKLGYEDLAAMLGKEKSTIRGQINSIKQKSENLISEITEKNGKKRVYISEEMREKMLKKSKVRVGNKKKTEKKEEKV
ncbi:MAG: hypothetical protein AABW51_00940 [Nanoarchaeota archaeon]